MTVGKKPTKDDEKIFEGLIGASGVPVSNQEKSELRKAYSSLMTLAKKTRKPGRGWDVRMLPVYSPKPPKGSK